MSIEKILKILFLAAGLAGCALFDDSAPKKPEAAGLIATPPAYYSTPKARYLGARYKDNLDRLVERITRNPKTAPLQFANNISSVGGIGFFTHSATKTPDERYLEVVLATPDTFEVKGEFNDKVQRLFSRYGPELLTIVSADNEIYQDREMTGYGLNLAWRNVVSEPAGNRVILERAVIYFPKQKTRTFLRQEINQNELLADAVIFAVEEDGPLQLVSYHPPESQPDVRPLIREDNLAAMAAAPKPDQSTADAAQGARPLGSARNSKPDVGAPGANALARKSEAPNKVGQPAAQPGDPIKPPARLPEAAKTATDEPQTLAQTESVQTSSLSLVKTDAPAVSEVGPLPPALAPARPQKAVDPLAGEQLAALKTNAAEAVPAKPAVARIAPKALEGFIIQIAFSDKEKAQRWAESMEKRGFAVSLTEAGVAGSFRVRLGNFAGRDDAERQLRTFKQDGLNGIVISLPRAFRPEALTSIP